MAKPRLTTRFALDQAQAIPDGAGGYLQTWQVLGFLWGALEVRDAAETFAGNVRQPRLSYRVIVRAAPLNAPSRPRPGQRLRTDDRVFRIQTVTEHDTRGRYLRCDVREEDVQ